MNWKRRSVKRSRTWPVHRHLQLPNKIIIHPAAKRDFFAGYGKQISPQICRLIFF
jgi:hypothetical protein